ncbi:MAG: DEAD/DEAH box helicase, partial [Gammaproteobacteria bacterium]|nr:DEAD/DEAH box helicase [Gammaproteobacteria bacterium]
MPSFLDTPAPESARKLRVGQLYGSSRGLLLSEQIRQYQGLSVIVCCDMTDAEQLEQEIRFFSPELPRVFRFPDLETLPYDQFSPHQDIVSERIQCLASISTASSGVLILPVSTLLQKVSPPDFIHQRSLNLQIGDRIEPGDLRDRLGLYGYSAVSQVEQHGEFSTRGSIIDLFPMGSPGPFRLDFFDDEIESIRRFDPETQRSIDKIDAIKLLPAQEYPLDEPGIKRFRLRFRETFEIDPNTCPVYVDISAGISSPGVEYYLPLFFDQLLSLFDYLPQQSRLLIDDSAMTHANSFASQVEERYQSRRYNLEWPLLEPERLFLDTQTLQARIEGFSCLFFSAFKLEQADRSNINSDTQALPQLTLQPNAEQPEKALRKFIEKPAFDRILISSESPGRREFVSEMLHHYGIHVSQVETWDEFLTRDDNRYYITASALQNGMTLESKGFAVITENQLFGERAVQKRRRRYRKTRDAESTIQSLADLQPGAPVVHEDHGVGRYQGLKTLTVSGIATEFLCIEYANQDKLYVPVSSLHLISRYAGASEDSAPLHRLGTEQWQRSRKKAQEKIHDIAVELLDIQARREAMTGFAHQVDIDEYHQFASEFPFEETPDQETTIESVITDMQSARPMDRIVCGDVGFGKTEVCMRAAFVAANAGSQVAVLVPTTLLAQQHYQNFLDRFADWPIRITSLTRFTARKSLDDALEQIVAG